MKKLVLALLCVLSLALVPESRSIEAAESFKKAPDSCTHAHAILGWSDFKQGVEEDEEEYHERIEKPWLKLSHVVGRLNMEYFKHPDEDDNSCKWKEPRMIRYTGPYKPGEVGSVTFKEYKVKGHENAKAYVAHCGHGGTCNMLAERLYRIYKGIGKPRVYCGKNAIPSVIHQPSDPELQDEEDELFFEDLCEADPEDDFDDDDDDDDFDDDDDDDDDDDGAHDDGAPDGVGDKKHDDKKKHDEDSGGAPDDD